jgi:hypothetical protein
MEEKLTPSTQRVQLEHTVLRVLVQGRSAKVSAAHTLQGLQNVSCVSEHGSATKLRAGQLEHARHTRLLVAVGGEDWYWGVGPVNSQSVMLPHTRSLVAVGASLSYCRSSQTRTRVHSRSLVAVGAADSNSPLGSEAGGLQAGRTGVQSALLVGVAGKERNSLPRAHRVTARQARSEVAVGPACSNWVLLQTLKALHTRSLVGVGTALSYSSAEQLLTGEHTSSARGLDGTAAYSPGAHRGTVRHTRSLVAVAGTVCNWLASHTVKFAHLRSAVALWGALTNWSGPHTVKFTQARSVAAAHSRAVYCVLVQTLQARHSVSASGVQERSKKNP